MVYKYSGKEYRININDAGLIECDELGITGETVDAVKTAIRETAIKENKLPRVPVLFFEKWDGYILIEGFSNLKKADTRYYRNNAYIWVSWKDSKGKPDRSKMGCAGVYVDTPANREIIAQYFELKKQIEVLNNQASELKQSLEIVKALEGVS